MQSQLNCYGLAKSKTNAATKGACNIPAVRQRRPNRVDNLVRYPMLITARKILKTAHLTRPSVVLIT